MSIVFTCCSLPIFFSNCIFLRHYSASILYNQTTVLLYRENPAILVLHYAVIRRALFFSACPEHLWRYFSLVIFVINLFLSQSEALHASKFFLGIIKVHMCVHIMLSILVYTFYSRDSWPILQAGENRSILFLGYCFVEPATMRVIGIVQFCCRGIRIINTFIKM